MKFENIKKTVRKFGNFSEDELQLFIKHLQATSFPKDYFVLKEGNISQSIYFICSGSFRQFQFNKIGDEITLNLFIENDWVLDYKSFTSQKTSSCIIQAMEESDVFELNVFELHKLIKISDSFFQMARIFQYAIDQNESRSQKISPKEKYVELLTNRPQIIQRFPLKHIASYLGITPETLSRVRRSVC